MRDKTVIPYRVLTNKSKKNRKNRKSTLECQNNNYFRSESMKTKLVSKTLSKDGILQSF